MADRLSVLNPRMAGNKAKQAREAREVQKAIEDRANRLGTAPPPYDFLELIGKGNFGRVFKSKERSTGAVCALKIIEVDEADYQDEAQYREDNINNFVKETQVLSKLKSSGAKNINEFFAAFSFHSQLWIVSEYCPGGSVRTLMRAVPGQSAFNPVGLDEGEVKRIARELAVALEGVHAAGVIHRDIKCANILIREDGQVQLCDFGVAGVLEGEVDKRSTIIGTPHWMPPEMVKDEVGKGYGVEVDMWEYGCTVYEMATGAPPDSRSDMKALRNRLRAPRLEDLKYSEELRDFVSFCLEPRPRDRPSATDVLRHPFIAGSEIDYPTSDLVQMIERYAAWESKGGDRTSLWQGGGAPGLSPLAEPAADSEDWNFSTTVEFDIQFSEQESLSDPFTNQGSSSNVEDKGTVTPPAPAPGGRRNLMLARQKAEKEQRIMRAGAKMAGLFDLEAPDYKYDANANLADEPSASLPDRSSVSDLALRNYGGDVASNRITMIDLDVADTGMIDIPDLDLADVSTLRASRFNRFVNQFEDEEEEEQYAYQPNRQSKRATMGWTFPTEPEEVPEEVAKNRRTMGWTFATAMAEVPEAPVEESQDYQNSGMARRTATKELELPLMTAPPTSTGRSTMDFSFPMMPAEPSATSDHGQDPNMDTSPPLGAAFRPQLKHAATTGNVDEFRPSHPEPDFPERTSLIDLDFARASMIDLDLADVGYMPPRPATASSTAESYITTGNETDITTGNPFDLDDQVQLSESNNRGSYHRQSQSEPQKRISGLLAAQEADNQGYASDHGPASQIRERHSREISNSSTRSSVTTDSDTSLANRLSGGRTWRGRTEQQHWGKLLNGLPDALQNNFQRLRGDFNTGSTPTSEPVSPSLTSRSRNQYMDTPPSANGSFSSSNFASPETALANGDETTLASTPRSNTTSTYSTTSMTYMSPRPAPPVPAYPSLRNGGRGSLVRTTVQAPLATTAKRPVPPHPATLEYDAELQGLVSEAKREGQDQILYLTNLKKTMKLCGASAQARRFGRRSSRSQIHASEGSVGSVGSVGSFAGQANGNGHVSKNEVSENEGFGASTSTTGTVRRISNASAVGSVAGRRVITN